MISLSNKKAAMELSIGTIVIIVLAMSMLIFGIILIRSIMCGALGLTGDINNKVKNEIQRLFQSQGGEVVCIGSGTKSVSIVKEETNFVWCTIKAPKQAEYEIIIDEDKIDGEIPKSEFRRWIIGTPGFKDDIPAGEENIKIMSVKPPRQGTEGAIRIPVKIYKDGDLIDTQQLDFEVRSSGWLGGMIC